MIVNAVEHVGQIGLRIDAVHLGRLDDRHGTRQGLRAGVSVFTINHVAKKLGEDPELFQAIVSNDDNLSYGSIISVYDGTDEALTALTDDGVDELRQMLAHARRTADEWNDFLEAFIDDGGSSRASSDIPAVTTGWLPLLAPRHSLFANRVLIALPNS